MADDALAYLQKMRFLKRVEPSDVSDEWAVVGLVGPAADAVLLAAGYEPTGGRCDRCARWRLRPPDTVGRRRPRGLEGTAGRRNRRPGRRRCGARRTVGLRGEAGRGSPATAAVRNRPSDDPARGGLDRHGGTSRQGLLSGPGDGGARAESGPAPASARARALGGRVRCVAGSGYVGRARGPVSWVSGNGRAAPRAWARGLGRDQAVDPRRRPADCGWIAWPPSPDPWRGLGSKPWPVARRVRPARARAAADRRAARPRLAVLCEKARKGSTSSTGRAGA